MLLRAAAAQRTIGRSQICRLGGSPTQLEVPLGRAERGALVRIEIRAGDIILATEKAHGLSALNTFSGNSRVMFRASLNLTAAAAVGISTPAQLRQPSKRPLALRA
jgi:ABC-type molybdate transport system ATPase subunit